LFKCLVGGGTVASVTTTSSIPAAFGLSGTIDDPEQYERVIGRFREQRILLPTFAQLRDPSTIPANVRAALAHVDPDVADPLNLFRVHWYNPLEGRGFVEVPDHVVLPPELTGVDSPIILAFGDRFPMITAHKVLAAYACLVPRVVTGQFDPTRHRAIWPSTGNYARGGVAISTLMGCRGVAVLPENMSRERFEWLDRWTTNPEDVIRTPGSESNVKEIYDTCNELEKDPGNFILNQFSEFANHVGHYTVTGAALDHVFRTVAASNPGLRLAAYVSASGSAGTLGAGDYLKDVHGSKIVAVEALECPTMLYNGFGEHNIQGIGDKHIPLIHNVMNTDVAVAVSDRATDELQLAANTPEGRAAFARRTGASPELLDALTHFGLSSWCNTLAAIKTAKALGLGPRDAIVTVATDGADLYRSEQDLFLARHYADGYDEAAAEAAIARHLEGADEAHVLECTQVDRNRIFNLGYFTWVEQQGVAVADFEARRHQSFWRELHGLAPKFDEMIDEFNARTGVTV
jgi:cysteine synthase